MKVNSCFHYYISELITVPSFFLKKDTAPLSSSVFLSPLLCQGPGRAGNKAEVQSFLHNNSEWLRRGSPILASSFLHLVIEGTWSGWVIFLAGNTYLASFHNA